MHVHDITETVPYLTFKLEEEMFAVDVSQVREILDMTTITRMPQAPDYMSGVINVRGSVVPVMDMRLKFGLAASVNTVHTRIIVMELAQDGETLVLGAIADSVHDVTELAPEQIEASPRIGTRWRTEFIKGIGKQEETFIIILDIDRVFSSEELALVDANSSAPAVEETE